MTKFTVTCDYYATGEGSTRMLLYTRAMDEEAARINFARRFDPYFAIGCKVESGWNLDSDFANLLITERVKNVLQGEDAHMEYSAHLHMNFS